MELLVGELYESMDKARLREVLAISKPSERMDALHDMMRDSISASTLGVYNGEMYYYDGEIYRVLPQDAFGDVIYDVFKRIGVPYGDYCRLEACIRVCRRKVYTKELRTSKSVVAFRNCIVDTDTMETHPHGREFVVFHRLGYDYDPEAKPTMWGIFLDQVLPNRIYQHVLQEFLGSLYVSRRDAKMETLMILHGNGGNGKSVVFDTVIGVLGKDDVSNFGLDELVGAGQERKRNMASINGKRLNYCSETRSMKIDAESGTLKALISGESTAARAMYRDNVVVDDLPQIMINANRLPEIKDWSAGMRRRLCIIPFVVDIPPSRQNRNLSAILRDEYSGIFNWIMEGRRRFVAQGYSLTESESIKGLIADYEVENNVVVKFMRHNGYLVEFDCVEDVNPCWIRATALYREFLRWAEVNFEVPVYINRFGLKLKEAGYKCRRSSHGKEYAVYGRKAVLMLQRTNEKAKISGRRAAFFAVAKLSPRITEEQRSQYAADMGCGDVLCGLNELAQYFNVSEPSARSVFTQGRLEGAYRIYGKDKVFNLDAIDRDYRQYLIQFRMVRSESRQEKRELKARMRDYENNNLL